MPSKHYSRNRGDWAKPGVIERLGEVRDSVIAAEVGVTRQRVEQVRKKLGIESYAARHPLPPELLELLGTKSDHDLAEQFEVEIHRVRTARRVAGISPYRLIGPIRIEHGTRYAYSRFFCRCTPCTAVNAEQMREWVKKNPEGFKKNQEAHRTRVLASAPHNPSNITNYGLGCRCDGCKQAEKDYRSPKHKRERTTSLAWGGVTVRRRATGCSDAGTTSA